MDDEHRDRACRPSKSARSCTTTKASGSMGASTSAQTESSPVVEIERGSTRRRHGERGEVEEHLAPVHSPVTALHRARASGSGISPRGAPSRRRSGAPRERGVARCRRRRCRRRSAANAASTSLARRGSRVQRARSGFVGVDAVERVVRRAVVGAHEEVVVVDRGLVDGVARRARRAAMNGARRPPLAIGEDTPRAGSSPCAPRRPASGRSARCRPTACRSCARSAPKITGSCVAGPPEAVLVDAAVVVLLAGGDAALRRDSASRKSRSVGQPGNRGVARARDHLGLGEVAAVATSRTRSVLSSSPPSERPYARRRPSRDGAHQSSDTVPSRAQLRWDRGARARRRRARRARRAPADPAPGAWRR